MFPVRLTCILCALLLLCGSVMAAEVDCDATYCFSDQDFAESEEAVSGICITQLPDPAVGTVMLGTRVIRSGDILAADQLSKLTLIPLKSQEDAVATVSYLPIYENRVEREMTFAVTVWGKEDKAPVAQDLAIETYKNVPNEGILKASDPEGEQLTYTVIRGPKRGEVSILEDGTFTYTPKKNKVGVDSFVYTATDPAGNVSRQATVTVQILKPTDSAMYTDTAGLSCRFEAQWLKNTGLFSGETVSGELCFFPDKEVSRGDFLAMLVKMLQIPLEQTDYSAIPEDVPLWLKPYVGAAMRSGLLEGLPQTQTGGFEAQTPITGAEVAVILQNALDLAGGENVQEELPVSVAALSSCGVELDLGKPLTRAEMAQLLYQVKLLAETAPGMEIIRKHS